MHGNTLALEMSIAPERRRAYSAMTQRIREVLERGGVLESRTTDQTGYRIEPALDDPNDRLVLAWHDPRLEDGDANQRARQRSALERILWLIADDVEDISGAHLQAWGDPVVVINYTDFET